MCFKQFFNFLSFTATHIDNQPSIIDYSHGNTTVYEGEQVSLHCLVKSNPTPPELKWVRQIQPSQREKYAKEKIIYHNENYYIFLPLQPVSFLLVLFVFDSIEKYIKLLLEFVIRIIILCSLSHYFIKDMRIDIVINVK